MKMIAQIQYHVVLHVGLLNGHGAYLLFQTGKDDPNENLKLMRDPQYPTVHLGYKLHSRGRQWIFYFRQR